jgi:dTDP-4-amino-4,6-dideoxygalactose transaminase
MLYERHGAAPSSKVFEEIRLETPNYSGRMDNLRASILRPQLKNLEKNINRWNERYQTVESELKEINGIEVPVRFEEEKYVGSSIQFRIPGISKSDAELFIKKNKELGVELKWFGNDNPSGFTSNHKSWKYVGRQQLDQSDEILSSLFDLRLPLTFSIDDCKHISKIIIECSNEFTKY